MICFNCLYLFQAILGILSRNILLRCIGSNGVLVAFMPSKVQDAAAKYVTAAAAATVAETVTFPLDLTKTRLQIQGEAASNSQITVRHGMLRVAFGIVREEGFIKLWQGLSPAVYRHLIYTGVRMGVYEHTRNYVLMRNNDGSLAPWKAIIGGLTAGSVGQFVASPMDLIKVQMQMDGKRLLEGRNPRATSVYQALNKIVSRGGVKGLWAGWVPNVQRAALVNMGDLATYDTVKRSLINQANLNDNWFCHFLSSVCSGFVAATLGTPADVIKTRVMNQKRDKNGKGLYYKSSIDCLLKTIRKEGFFSLYKGFVPIWSRMAPWSLTFWLTWEEIRKLSGLSSF